MCFLPPHGWFQTAEPDYSCHFRRGDIKLVFEYQRTRVGACSRQLLKMCSGLFLRGVALRPSPGGWACPLGGGTDFHCGGSSLAEAFASQRPHKCACVSGVCGTFKNPCSRFGLDKLRRWRTHARVAGGTNSPGSCDARVCVCV